MHSHRKATQAQPAPQTIAELWQHVQGQFIAFGDRFALLEKRVGDMDAILRQKNPCTQPSPPLTCDKAKISPTTSQIAKPTPPPSQLMTPTSETQLSVQFVEFTHEWGEGIEFPPFELVVSTDIENMDKFSKLSLQLQLQDGFGNFQDNLLSDKALANERDFPPFEVSQETSTAFSSLRVSGLRICRVSSKHGGAFKFVCTLVRIAGTADIKNTIDGSIATIATSPAIRILCRRNFDRFSRCAPLEASDDVSRMVGIGDHYARRFADNNIACIRDLSKIELNSTTFEQLFSSVRQTRGRLTRERLINLVHEAQRICSDTTEPAQFEPSPVGKKAAAVPARAQRSVRPKRAAAQDSSSDTVSTAASESDSSEATLPNDPPRQRAHQKRYQEQQQQQQEQDSSPPAKPSNRVMLPSIASMVFAEQTQAFPFVSEQTLGPQHKHSLQAAPVAFVPQPQQHQHAASHSRQHGIHPLLSMLGPTPGVVSQRSFIPTGVAVMEDSRRGLKRPWDDA